MNFSFSPRCLSALLASALLVAPNAGFGRDKVTVYRDRDGDGHYNKKTYETSRRYPFYGNNYRGNYYGGGYGHYSRPYYGYGHSYYRGYSRPYFGYGYGPSVGITYYSQPSYAYETTRVYRGAPAYDPSDDLAIDVQRALKRRGYYSGSIDGDIGPGSRSAIRSYQADRGLPVTGRIDSSLLRALGIG